MKKNEIIEGKPDNTEELLIKLQKKLSVRQIEYAIGQFQIGTRDIKISEILDDLAIYLKQLTKSHKIGNSIIYSNIIMEMMKINNGYITTGILKPLNISREYISQLEKDKLIERVDRGIYVLPKTFYDSYYIFQLKYNKVVFSHMNALYFHNLTEEFPSSFTVTVPNSYHIEDINREHSIFYVNDNIVNLGLIKIKTPNGNNIRAYDMERCICDIIRSEKRMDLDQVKKSVRTYIKRTDKDMSKLSKYAEFMGISKKVVNFVSMMYE